MAAISPSAAHHSPALIASTTGARGWLYELLRWVGVPVPTAHHLQGVVGKPVALLLVLLLALVANRLGNRVIRRWIGSAVRTAASRAGSPRAASRSSAMTSMAASVWTVVVVVIALLTALGVVGINLTPFLAGATVLGATLGFGAQSLVKDILSGFLLVMEDQFGIGDQVCVNDVVGTVEEVSLRVTCLRSFDGTMWFLPNGDIRKVANKARGWARATVDVVVPAASDVDTVLQAAKQAGASIAQDGRYAPSLIEPVKTAGIVDATADTLTTRVSIKVPHAERDRIEQALREAVARHLRQAGVFEVPGQA